MNLINKLFYVKVIRISLASLDLELVQVKESHKIIAYNHQYFGMHESVGKIKTINSINFKVSIALWQVLKFTIYHVLQ